MGLFLDTQGHSLSQHTYVKSASSLSRFINHYSRSFCEMIRIPRQAALQQIGQHPFREDSPLKVLINLTTLEQCSQSFNWGTATDDPQAPGP